MNGVVAKPIQAETLVAAIEQALEAAAQAPADVLPDAASAS